MSWHQRFGSKLRQHLKQRALTKLAEGLEMPLPLWPYSTV